MSSFAGNAMVISPASLIMEGLLKATDRKYDFAPDLVDYDSVILFKNNLLVQVWTNFKAGERLAWSSMAALAIAPLQDLLNLGGEARMNVPGRASGNWRWRCREEMLPLPALEWLHEMTESSKRLGRDVTVKKALPELVSSDSPVVSNI
jgi:4-alpha-glucanotransferase